MSEFREAEFEVRNGDIIHTYDDPSYLELLKHEREIQASITALDDENAKLRELVRHLYMCNQHLDRDGEDGGCVLCPYLSIEYDCEFEQRICELGVEVDG